MEPNLEKLRKTPSDAPRENRRDADLISSVDFTDLDKITEDSLGFSALTEGLGFHPKERKLGTLRPSNKMETTEFVAARETVPTESTAKSAAYFSPAPAPGPQAQPFTPAPIYQDFLTALETSTPVRHTPILQPANAVGARPATARERLAAFAIDLAAVALPIWLTLLWNFAHEPNFLFDHRISAFAFIFVVFLGYLLIAESLGGQSLGKMALDLVVVEDDKYRKPIGFERSLLRLAAFLLGLLPFGLGSIAAVWDSNSRTWHDRVSGSAVERMSQD